MAEPAPLILIVDDSADVRKTTALILRKHGFQTAEAQDGEEAVREAQRLLPALILLDLGMPKVDGFEATRRIRADERTHAIPIIVVSAYDRDQFADQALKAGADAFLQKPVLLKPLLMAVRRALGDKA